MLRLLAATFGFVGVNPIYRLEVRRWRCGTRALLALGVACSALYAPGFYWAERNTRVLSATGDGLLPLLIWGPFILGACVSAVLASLTVVRWRKRGFWEDLLLSLVDRGDVLVAVLVPAMRAGIALLVCLLLGWAFYIGWMLLQNSGADSSEGVLWLGALAMAAVAGVGATGLGGMLGAAWGMRCRDSLHATAASGITLLLANLGIMACLLCACAAGGADGMGLLRLSGTTAACCYSACWSGCAGMDLLLGALLWRRLMRWMGAAAG